MEAFTEMTEIGSWKYAVTASNGQDILPLHLIEDFVGSIVQMTGSILFRLLK